MLVHEKTESKESGFTLIEVMIAISIISIALAGLLSAISQAIVISSATKERQEAMNAAQRQLELLRSYTPDEIQSWITANGGTDDDTDFTVDGLFPRDDDGDGAVGEVAVSAGINAEIRVVTITIEWSGAAGNQSLQLIGRSGRN